MDVFSPPYGGGAAGRAQPSRNGNGLRFVKVAVAIGAFVALGPTVGPTIGRWLELETRAEAEMRASEIRRELAELRRDQECLLALVRRDTVNVERWCD